MKLKSLLLFLLFSPFWLLAQEYVDLAKFYYTYSPNNHYDESGETTEINDFGTEILLPIPLESGHAVITGFAFERTRLRPDPTLDAPINLYTINPRIGLNYVHNKKWTGQYVLLPQIASDLTKGVSLHDMQLGFIAVLSYKKSEQLQYRLGGYYNSALYGPGGFLIGGLFYQNKKKNLTFDLALPIWADANYKVSKMWSGGIRFDAMIRSYYLNTPLMGEEVEYITRLTPDLYAYVQLAVAKNYIVQLKVGHSILRNYDIYEIGDQLDFSLTGINFNDDRTLLNNGPQDGFILQLRFHYRFFL